MTSNKHLTLLLWLFITTPAFTQQQILPVALAVRLDSVRMSAGNERHFGELYLRTTHYADIYIESLTEQGKLLMRRLEERFAIYFLRAVDSNNKGAEIPDEWKSYFNAQYSPLQLKLIGANAHINGDIWRALTDNFSLPEIRELTPFYKNYHGFIRTVYDKLFATAISSDKRLRDLHLITLSLDKVYGRMLLKKWRNRQLKLAIYKFEDEKRFQLLKKRIAKRKNRIDQLIIRRLCVNQ